MKSRWHFMFEDTRKGRTLRWMMHEEVVFQTKFADYYAQSGGVDGFPQRDLNHFYSNIFYDRPTKDCHVIEKRSVTVGKNPRTHSSKTVFIWRGPTKWKTLVEELTVKEWQEYHAMWERLMLEGKTPEAEWMLVTLGTAHPRERTQEELEAIATQKRERKLQRAQNKELRAEWEKKRLIRMIKMGQL